MKLMNLQGILNIYRLSVMLMTIFIVRQSLLVNPHAKSVALGLCAFSCCPQPANCRPKLDCSNIQTILYNSTCTSKLSKLIVKFRSGYTKWPALPWRVPHHKTYSTISQQSTQHFLPWASNYSRFVPKFYYKLLSLRQ